MEKLKKLSEILHPDERQKHFGVLLDNGNYQSLTLEYIYDNAESIKLHEGVPEEIRSHFATAQNFLVYSWFYYPFNVTAQFLAFVTLEYALRIRLEAKKKIRFKKLVEMAVEKGLVKDSGFTHINNEDETEKIIEKKLGVVTEEVKNYCETLVETIPYLRNEIAHGSRMLHNSGGFFVRICSEFINQLFEVEHS